MKCSIMLHFVWVFTVSQIARLGVSRIQRVKITVWLFSLDGLKENTNCEYVLCHYLTINNLCLILDSGIGNVINKISHRIMNTSLVYSYKMSYNMRKPVFGVCNQVETQLACSATETSWNLENVNLTSILSRQ